VMRTVVNMNATAGAAAALAAFGAAGAIPIALAQLDFAGALNVFNIDGDDVPSALSIMAAIGGVLTLAVISLALAGAALALVGAPSARALLVTAAIAGFVTASPVWLPAGIVLGAAAVLADHAAARAVAQSA
jgi:hypothetical protein